MIPRPRDICGAEQETARKYGEKSCRAVKKESADKGQITDHRDGQSRTEGKTSSERILENGRIGSVQASKSEKGGRALGGKLGTQ